MITFFLFSFFIATNAYPADLEIPPRSLATPKNKTVAASLGIQLGSGNINWLAPATIVWLAQADDVNIKQKKWLIDWARNAGATECTLEALKRLNSITLGRYKKLSQSRTIDNSETEESVYTSACRRIQNSCYGRMRQSQSIKKKQPNRPD